MEYAGLSEYEAKVYLSLIGLGSSRARKLSINCKVPRTKVYGTLKKLIEYGLVIEIPGVPKCFTPISPLNAFGSTVKRNLNKALDFSQILESLTDTHETSMKEASPQQKTLWYIDSDDDIIGKFHEIVSQAKETLEVVASADGLTLFFNSAPNLLDQMQNIGVDVRIFSPLDPKANPLARELSYLFDVRKVDISSPLLFVDSDHKSFILAKVTDINGDDPLEAAVFSDDENLLSILHLITSSLMNGQDSGAAPKIEMRT
ncbi:TrmB family transcriptional regulator [Candidatus Bathyarchaeota archaeon]|nr:TrmB family transcriptional regulator [Candidatus Bathyarchaeota archaeon]MBL7080722.1 TrmB family transcriptional regulator [Candidatus Bathyarchaeota archaeon]